MTDRTKSQWFWRRLLIFGTAALAGGLLIWLTWHGTQDGKLHALIAEGCFWLLVADLMLYVAGATSQDIVAMIKGFRGVAETAPPRRGNDDDRQDYRDNRRAPPTLPAN